MKSRADKLLEKRSIELERAEEEIERLARNIRNQSIILNKIRETLLTKTDWNGIFSKGEDLSNVMEKYLVKRGAACPPQ
jgi:hypothetical protein